MTNGCTNEDTVCVIIMVIGNRRFEDDCLPIEISIVVVIFNKGQKTEYKFLYAASLFIITSM